jgi:transposase
VLATVDGGLRVREAAPLFRVSVSYIYKALERRAATGQTAASARGGLQRPPVPSGHEAALLEHLRSNPDAPLAELRRWLFEAHGVSISVGALWNGLDRLGWTLKKVAARRGAGVLVSTRSDRRCWLCEPMSVSVVVSAA